MNQDRVVITAIDFQRNGVGGVGFHTLEMEGRICGIERRFIATVFSSETPEDENGNEKVEVSDGYCAVQEVDQNGRIVPTGWRGDRFESALRLAIFITEDERFFTSNPNTPESERRKVLVILVDESQNGDWRIEDRIRKAGTPAVAI